MTSEKHMSVDCAWALRALELHLDGELSVTDERRFAGHIGTCASCMSELANARELKAILGMGDTTLVLDEPLEESTEIVMSRIQGLESGRKMLNNSHDRRSWIAGALSLAASLLIFSVLTWYGRNMMGERSDFASSPRQATQFSSPMLTSVHSSAQTSTSQTGSADDELLATGMMALATPGILSRIETVAALYSISQSTEHQIDSTRLNKEPR